MSSTIFQHGRQAWSVTLACVMGVLAHSGNARVQNAAGDDVWDLKLLTTIVPKYKVDAMPLKLAVAELYVAAFGGTAEDWKNGASFSDPEASDRKITLDLEKIPAPEVIKYLAELGGCHWKFWGWPGAPQLSFESLDEIDDTGLFYHSDGFPCSLSAAKALGIKAGMSSQDLVALFRTYGLSAADGATLFWNEKTEMIGSRNFQRENDFVRALVKLSEEGWRLSKTTLLKPTSK